MRKIHWTFWLYDERLTLETLYELSDRYDFEIDFNSESLFVYKKEAQNEPSSNQFNERSNEPK